MLDGIEVSKLVGLFLPDVGHAEGKAVVCHGWIIPAVFAVFINIFSIIGFPISELIILEFSKKYGEIYFINFVTLGFLQELNRLSL